MSELFRFGLLLITFYSMTEEDEVFVCIGIEILCA